MASSGGRSGTNAEQFADRFLAHFRDSDGKPQSFDSVPMPRSVSAARPSETQKSQNREHSSKQKRLHKILLIRALAVRIVGGLILRGIDRS